MDFSFSAKPGFGEKTEKPEAIEGKVEKPIEPQLIRPVQPTITAERTLRVLTVEVLRHEDVEAIQPVLVEPEVVKPVEVKRGRGRPSKTDVPIQPAAPEVLRHENRAEVWHPTEEDFKLARELGELGWSAEKLCTALTYTTSTGEVRKITSQQFAGAIIRYPRLKTEYESGVEECKGFKARKLSWQPMPADITTVRDYAKDGLRVPEIAAKMKISRTALTQRMADTPQLQEAFDEGSGLYRAELLLKTKRMVDFNDEDLKHVSPMLKFLLQSQCEMTDKVEKPVVITGAIEHNHKVQLKAPEPVKLQNLAAMADKEMARAKEISKVKLLEMQAAEAAKEAEDALEAEVVK